MREAVAAILVCDHELYIIRRQNYLRAFPGYYAFPGGKVDEEDRDFVCDFPLPEGVDEVLVGALSRELQEELQFDLLSALRAGDVAGIVPFGLAVTPDFEPVRFRAHYYKVVLHSKPAFIPERGEIAWGGWMHMDDIWARYCDGQGLMVVPVQRSIGTLQQDIGAVSAGPLNMVHDPEVELPYFEVIHGLGMIPVSSRTLPPAKFTYALYFGDQGYPRFLVDPSPESPEILSLLMDTLKQHPIDKILITHHHHDHHEFAPKMARDLNIPLCCTAKTEARMLKQHGADYLEGIVIEHVGEGTVLTRWLGRDVCCFELPGHDDGMVGFWPTDRSWIMVADLVQPQGTVVIPEDGGDMAHYFESLQRMIDMEPRVVFSSHGMPTGGIELLRKTLEHRSEREKQIDALHQQGLDQDEITELVYTGIPEALYSLALQNVRQHLRKLGVDIN